MSSVTSYCPALRGSWGGGYEGGIHRFTPGAEVGAEKKQKQKSSNGGGGGGRGTGGEGGGAG